MKKVLSLLVAILFLLSLNACCATTDPELLSPSISSDDSNLENESPNASADLGQVQNDTISETVLLDEAGVKITAKSLEMNSLLGPEIKLLIENTSGINLTVQARNVSVNGYMIEPIMSVDIVSGKKANDSIIFSESDLDLCGIKTIADIELSFHIFSTDDWETYLDSKPIQLKTTAADTYTYTFDDSGEDVYNSNDVKIVIKGLSENDSILGPGIIVYIYNNSQKNITVQTRDISINGFMVDAVFSSDVVAGKHRVDSITFFSSDLEENGITQIETAELSFHIFNADSWNTIADTDTIVINF